MNAYPGLGGGGGRRPNGKCDGLGRGQVVIVVFFCPQIYPAGPMHLLILHRPRRLRETGCSGDENVFCAPDKATVLSQSGV